MRLLEIWCQQVDQCSKHTYTVYINVHLDTLQTVAMICNTVTKCLKVAFGVIIYA